MSGSGWSLRRRLAAALTTAAVLLLALVAFASVTLVKVHRHQDDVTNRYYVILSNSNALFLALIDAETAVRGYIITGNETALDPLKALSSPDFQRQGPELKAKVAGDGDLEQKLGVVSASAGNWYRTFVQPAVDKVRTQGPRSVSAQTVDAGKVQFDAIRSQYADYRGEALAKRTAANKALDP